MRTIDRRLGLSIFVRDERVALLDLIENTHTYFDEIVVLDTGSTDNTQKELHKLEAIMWPKLQIYLLNIPLDADHFHFGQVRSTAAHLNHCGYVFMLDVDERITPHDLQILTTDCHRDALSLGWPAVAFQRHNWYDSPEERKSENREVLPDWQVRMIRNDGTHRWQRPVHETCMGGPVWHWDASTMGYDKIWLHHHHMWFKKDQKPVDRNKLYEDLKWSDPRWTHTYEQERWWEENK